jgi:hypothetical protein
VFWQAVSMVIVLHDVTPQSVKTVSTRTLSLTAALPVSDSLVCLSVGYIHSVHFWQVVSKLSQPIKC